MVKGNKFGEVETNTKKKFTLNVRKDSKSSFP
jgi:hypothetical protein